MSGFMKMVLKNSISACFHHSSGPPKSRVKGQKKGKGRQEKER